MLNFLRKIEKFYKVLIVLIDLAIINIAYILAFIIVFNWISPQNNGDIVEIFIWNIPAFNFEAYTTAFPFITISALIYFDIYGLLKFFRKTLYDVISSIFFIVLLLGITTMAITFFMREFSFPRSVLLITPVIQFILLATWKTTILYGRKHIIDEKRIMIIGSLEETNLVIDKMKSTLFNTKRTIKHVFNVSESEKILKKLNNVDEVFICPKATAEQKKEILSRCIGSKKIVYIIPQLFEISLLKSKMVQFEDIPAYMIDKLELTIEQKFLKRVFDIVVSIFFIIILLPVMVLIGIIVKSTSKGPIIFVQDRVTYNGKTFKIYKFRTMYKDVEQKTGPVISGKDDPRVTSLGKILRKTRLDETPQFFNVLKGEMSIVGPRSERPHFVEKFSRDIPDYNNRSSVKAGITGYAQILGNYDTSPEDKLRYDLIYIKNYSLLLDMKLIFQTIQVVFTGKNISNKTFKRNISDFKKAANS